MMQTQLTNALLDQSKDLIWMIDKDFQLLYANKAYQSIMKAVIGMEKKLNEPLWVEGFGEGYIEKWEAYYNRALKGEYFEIEEHYLNPSTNKIQYDQITFEPLRGADNKVFALACQSKDITLFVKQQSEAKQMMDASLDVFCTVNEQGIFIYVSAASLNHWGYSPEELIGTSFRDLLFEEDVPKTNEKIADLHRGEGMNSFVNRYKKKDGSLAYNLWTARWDATTKLRYAVAKDCKDKVQQEEKVRESELRFRSLVQEGSDLIGILDVEGNYMYVSPTSKSVLGIAPEEFIGRNTFEFIHADDAERTLVGLQKISTEDKVILEPFRFQNNKKEWRWIETVLTNMLDNPAVKGIVANSRDVTEKVNALKEIEANELFNRTVLESSPDCFKVLDKEGRIQYMNYNGLCQMEIDDFSTIQNKDWWSLWGSENEALVKSSVDKALTGETAQFVAFCPTAKGMPKWWDVAVSPVGKPGERVLQIISVSRDITEQKIKEQEIELLAQISANFNAENDYLNATQELCKSISKFGKFDWVELWTSNLERSQMQLFSHYVAAPEDELFYQHSSMIDEFKKSESLAGKVWSEAKQILLNDIEKKNDFIRRDAAKKIGLKSVLGIPLIFNNEVIGVLKIGTKNDANYLKNHSQLFKKLEGFIGSEINRKKLENNLSHLFDAIPDIICLLDLKGRFLTINKSGCELMGFREEEILYHRFEEFVHSDDKGVFTNEFMQLEKEKVTFKFESRHITKSGELVWLNWYCNSTLKEGIIYSTAKNITEEKKLMELNRQAGSLAKIGSWEVDLVNQTLYWSDEVHQLHDTDSKLFLPNLEGAINFYREDFREMVQVSIGNSISTGEPFDFEAVLVTAKKKELWVRAIGNAEFEDGQCKRIYGSFQDIHERKVAEIRLQSLADNLPGVVYQYMIYPDGTDSLKYVTKGSQQVWGFTAEEVMHNNQLVWDRILLGGEFEKVKKSISDSIESKTKWTARWKYVMPNGETKTHLGYGSPNFLADGTILFHSVILDITKEANNEELLEQVTKQAKIGSWEIDMEQNKSYWSVMVHNILETDPESYLQEIETSFDFYREDFRALAQSKFADCMEKGISFDYEAAIVTANKNKKWVLVLGSAEIIDGIPKRIYGSLQDINERKEAEEKLFDSEQKYRQQALHLQLQQLHLTNAQQVAKVGSWETDLSNFKITWSDETYRIFGTDRESFEPTHEKFLSFVHPLDRDRVDKAFADSAKASIHTNNVIEHRIVTASGEVKEVEERWQMTYNDKGEPLLAIGSCQDITSRKIAEEENRFKANLLSIIGQAAIATNLDGVVNYWNNAAEAIYGWKREEAIGNNIMGLTTPEANEGQAKEIMEMLKKGETWSGEFIVRKKDGTHFPAFITNSPVFDENNTLSGIIGISSDITSEVKNKELLNQYTLELERSNEELEQFAFVASHDLQEPLRMISSFMEQLQRKYGDRLDEKGQKYIHFATDGAKRMKQIILDLLEYSRAGRTTDGEEEVDLNEIVSEFKQLRRKLISEKKASIESNDLPTLNTYKAAITQILHCLLDNALKYSAEGIPPMVNINAIENENEWEFSIKDNGIGIDPQFYDKIFIIFQRLHNKDEYEGTGIGLSVAKRHVEFLGGRIWLESQLGEGTIFYFTIPKTK
jgi:PAS domain S-box-containing protein